MKKIILLLICLFPIRVLAEDLSVSAGSGILMEYSSGEVLYELNSNEKMAPASMTKIMTLAIIMEELNKGNIALTDEVVISANAASMGGSQVFLDANSKIKLEDLLKAIVIASANDAAVAMAEYISGSTTAFVERMNQKAKEIGCKNTNFINVHGLDDDNHYTTAYDMALMAKELLKYEDILKYTTIYESYLNKPDGTSIWMVNTNKLIKYYNGLDGLKTGFTAKAGYCLTSTAKRNDMRLITVLMKEETSKIRNEDTTKLLDYGFANYKMKTIKNDEEIINKIYIYNSKKEEYDVYLEKNASNLEKISENNIYTYNVKLDEVKAPLKAMDKVGEFEVISNNKVIDRINLVVKEDVKKANIFDLFVRNINYILVGDVNQIRG